MSEFTNGVLFLRRDLAKAAAFIEQIEEFSCIVNHLNSKWSVLFFPQSVGDAGEELGDWSNQLPLLEFWNNGDHGWGFRLYVEGELQSSLEVDYEQPLAESPPYEYAAEVHVPVFQTLELTINQMEQLHVLYGCREARLPAAALEVECFKDILGITEMAWLSYDRCEADVLEERDGGQGIGIGIQGLMEYGMEEPILGGVSAVMQELSPFREHGKYGYINDAGDVVVRPQFEMGDFFNGNYALVKTDGRYGFINAAGEQVIETVYDKAASLNGGYGLVELGGKVFVLHESGRITAEADPAVKFHFGLRFSEGKALVNVNGLLGYMDETGKLVIEPKYKTAGHFNDGFAFVSLPGGETYYTDHQECPLRIPEGLQVGRAFSEGLAVVSRRTHSAVIDTAGSLVIEKVPFLCGFCREGLMDVPIGHWKGYINRAGAVEIEPSFDEAFSFNNGIAMVSVKGKTGFINKSGTLYYRPQKYHNTNMQSVGRSSMIFRADYEGKTKYISKLTGEPVFELSERMI